MGEQRVLLITGASSGIGAEVARQARELDFKVVLAARSIDKIEALASELGGSEYALPVGCDVTDWDQQQTMVAAALEKFGQLDVVFANAGFGAKRGFTEETPDHWREMILTNVLGPALTVRATIDAVAGRSGHFVLTGSVAGRRSLPGSVYSSTKWAVTGMAESLRQELRSRDDAGKHTRVTLIGPGMTDTPFFDKSPEGALEPKDVADAVIWSITRPAHVDINEVLLRPTAQAI